jgi:cytochrome c peroxidase
VPRIAYRKLLVAAVAVFAACAYRSGWTVASAYGEESHASHISPVAAVGGKIFNDRSLSASGQMSCASCHSPQHGYGPPDGRAVRLGGRGLNRQGARAVPSLRYTLNRTPIWHKTFIENNAERLTEGDEPATGGFGWDGRFNTLHEQAAFPLLASNEMANARPDDVVARLRRAAYADDLRTVFGQRIFDDPYEAFEKALFAIERFELEDPSFHPYNSKFDDYLDGRVQLSEQERRGLTLFDDRRRGNCASCHLDRIGADGSHPLFTDYEFEALGVPRNSEIRANADPRYFDMGLCGPARKDQAGQSNYCGLFRTPTLRNVATRKVFFHNGRFHSLKDALRFYVRRDTDPRLWYPSSRSGALNKFDDLPPELRGNIDVTDEPLTRREGASPAWTDTEIDDVMAFLQTLTDRDVALVRK